MDTISNIIIGIFVLMLLGLIFYGHVANLLMLLSLFIFGLISSYFKKSKYRFLSLGLLVLLSLINVYINGINWGIDFKGGTRIPLTLSHTVDVDTMREIVNKIKTRASALGMEQINVKSVGDDLIYVEVPSDNEETLNNVEKIITEQGVYNAVVDGRIVLTGEDILPGTISSVPPQYLQGADWGVQFSITSEAATKFARLVKGKAGYPVYMFLDKPNNSVIVLNQSKLVNNLTVDYVDLITALNDVLENDAGHIKLLFESNYKQNLINDSNVTYIVEKGSSVEKYLKDHKYNVVSYDEKDMYPHVIVGQNTIIINSWKAIGLISAPTLSESVTKGSVSLTYTISGQAEGYGAEKAKNAKQQTKEMISLLKGGSFPVKIEAGSRTSIPPTLGEKFLHYSVIAILVALVFIALFVSIRYRKLKIILPMLLVTIVELIILISLVGSFTIDLSAMAGILASIGVSIDAQIVITDELLKEKDVKTALSKSFYIINNNALVAILAMMPLLFMSVVEVIGFALSTILAYLLGVLVSRPAYAMLVEKWLLHIKSD